MATETWQVHTLKAERKNFRPLFSLRKLEFVQCMEKKQLFCKNTVIPRGFKVIYRTYVVLRLLRKSHIT